MKSLDESKEPRIIAPGGNLDQIRIAVSEGAHAVYSGPRFMSGRAGYAEMDFDQLTEARRITAEKGVEFYIAVNRSIPPDKREEWRRDLDRIAGLSPDALIVGSPCVYLLLREMDIQIPLHASTFWGIYNYRTVALARRLGFKRIVLNTGLFFDEIEDMVHRSPGMDFEVIAYGGICTNDNHRCNLPHGIRQNATEKDPETGSKESAYCQLRLEIADAAGRTVNSGRLMCSPLIDISPNLGSFLKLGIRHFKIAGRERPGGFVSKAVQSLKKGISDAIANREAGLETDAYILPVGNMEEQNEV